MLRRVNLEMLEGTGPTYPQIKTLEVVFCGSSDKDLLYVCCMCPNLEYVTVVVSMSPASPAQPPQQPPQHGMASTHLHSLCHNPRLVQAIVLVKVGEGWIQVDNREMLGELVLGAVSEHLRKVCKF